MNWTPAGWQPKRNGQNWQPRPCAICGLMIDNVTSWKQTAHPGACKAEQTRRYLAQVAEENKKKRSLK